MKTFLCEESVLRHNKTNCFPSYLDHYLNITDQSSIVCCYCCFLTFFLHYFYFCSFLIIKKNCPWTQSMTGGPWTRSMKVVHGPDPKWGSMDPWSLFCPHPFVPARRVCQSSITILSPPPSPPSFTWPSSLRFWDFFTPAGHLTSCHREAVSCCISKLGKDALRLECEKVRNL